MTDVIVIWEQEYDQSWIVDVVSPDRFGEYIEMARQHLVAMLKIAKGYEELDVRVIETRIQHHDDDMTVNFLVDFGNGKTDWRDFQASRRKVNDFLKPAFNG